MTKTEKMLDIIARADLKGFVKLDAGLGMTYYFASQYSMTADQLTWDKDHPFKDLDFSTSNYWLTDDFFEPFPVKSISDLNGLI